MLNLTHNITHNIIFLQWKYFMFWYYLTRYESCLNDWYCMHLHLLFSGIVRRSSWPVFSRIWQNTMLKLYHICMVTSTNTFLSYIFHCFLYKLLLLHLPFLAFTDTVGWQAFRGSVGCPQMWFPWDCFIFTVSCLKQLFRPQMGLFRWDGL